MTGDDQTRDGTPGAPAPHPPAGDRATKKEWAGLVLLVLPMLAVATDLTVLFLALPTLSADLGPTASQGLWIVHVYGFLIAGFLVTMGRLGDRIGPRRLLLIGAVAFAAMSAVAAFSVNATMLVIARALLGVAGATLMPSLFSLLRTMFRDDKQRRMAIAIMFSAFSVGGAIGPLLGGALLEFFWWGSVFLVNVPPMVLLALLGTGLLPERAQRNRARLDLTSVALSVAGMLAVVYGLQELAAGQETGTGSVGPNLAVAATGVLLLVIFARRQHRLNDPLFDLALLANRRIAASLASLLLVGTGMVGMFYLFTQYLQWVAGLSPLQAGLWTVPYIVANIAGAMVAPALADRKRPAVVVALALGVTVLGALLLLAVTGPSTALPLLLAAVSVCGLGQGAAMALVSDLIITSVPTEQTGSAAAAQEVGGELGTALGVAVGGAAGMVVYRASLAEAMPSTVPTDAADAALSSIHEAVTLADTLGGGGASLIDAVHEAVALGLRTFAGVGAVLIGAATLLVTVVLVLRDRPRKREAEHPAGEEQPAEETP